MPVSLNMPIFSGSSLIRVFVNSSLMRSVLIFFISAAFSYTAAKVYADSETAKANGFEEPTKTELAVWSLGQIEFDEVTYEVMIPDIMSHIENYIIRASVGKYIEEINVVKLKDAQSVAIAKSMIEEHAKRQSENQDYALYNDDGRNGQMIGTGKVEAFGNFVVYACTLDSSLSMLRAEKYIAENPNATSVDVYRAMVCELYE